MHLRIKFFILFLFLLISIIVSLQFGSINISFLTVIHELAFFMQNGQMSSLTNETILLTIRLPRTLFAIIAGAGLALTGLSMQTVTRNSLADPYILGVSSGASAGAVCAIVLGWFSCLGQLNISTGAFLGAVVSTGLVLLLIGRSSNPVKLILIGMGISAFFTAMTMMLIYSAHNEAQVRSAMFWLLGSLTGITWSDLPLTSLVIIFTLIFLWTFRHDLDVLLLGADEASHLGLSVKNLQFFIVIITSFCVAVLVAKAGLIGFVGLIAPHLARILVGPRHDRLIIFSALVGSNILLWGDALARSLFHPEEVPIGVLTACIGAPLFIWIICRRYGDE